MAQKPKGLSPHSQQPATGLCPEQVESNPHPPASLPKIHSDPILSPTPSSSEWSLSFRLSHQNHLCFSLHSHAHHMPFPLHSSWLGLPNDIWGWVQLWSSSLCNFLHSPVTSSNLDQNILPRTLFSNTLSLCSFLSVRYKVSHKYKTTGRIMFFSYVLTLHSWTGGGMSKNSTEW
jgi:hypothetical protein